MTSLGEHEQKVKYIRFKILITFNLSSTMKLVYRSVMVRVALKASNDERNRNWKNQKKISF